VRDEPVDYAVADGLGQYSTVDGELGFVSPRGRSVCWSIGFCGEFGGDTTGTMSFMGWSYSEDPTAVLQSTSGAMLGMRWSELPSLHAEAGGCYSIGSGGIDGIRLTLQSAGEPFGSFDDAGNYITNVPDPAAVTIISMETGDVPVFLYGDC
jgi:hypothetical protein